MPAMLADVNTIRGIRQRARVPGTLVVERLRARGIEMSLTTLMREELTQMGQARRTARPDERKAIMDVIKEIVGEEAFRRVLSGEMLN